jgi:hypothetical protein
MARICIVTAGHLATCPRMVKAADALSGAGHAVRVVSTRHVPWAVAGDADMRRSRRWPWRVIDYSRSSGGALYLTSAVRRRLAEGTARACGADRIPLAVAIRAYSRVHDELVTAAADEPADLIYGGTTGALAATAEAARRSGTRFALDLEDFHAEEQPGAGGVAMNTIASRIERRVLRDAAFLTAAGSAIADEYERVYGVRPIPVNNTFPLPLEAPDPSSNSRPLRFYWFSQTIGPFRGLEDIIGALCLAGIPCELHLRGRLTDGYLAELRRLAAGAPQLRLEIHPPAVPDAMVDLCRDHDVGLAIEQPVTRSRALCVTNKALTYVIAGLPLVLTDTPGHQVLARELGGGALMYAPGCIEQLAAGLRGWHDDRGALASARRAVWAAAVRRWHWEHPLERGALLAAVEGVLN